MRLIFSTFIAITLAMIVKAQSPNPTIRMILNPNNPQSVVVYVDWQNLSGETDAWFNTLKVSMWTSQAAGTPTFTTVQGSGWNLQTFHNATTVASAISNPDNMEYREYYMPNATSFGNVSAAGTVDTLFRLTFPSGGAGHTARLVEGNNGSGGNAMDNMWTGFGFKPVNEYSENGNSSYTAHDGTQTGTVSPLPVDLTHFDVNAFNTHDAKIDWATASEFNNSHFEVQRSFDGYNFTTIGEVKGNGTSHSLINYSYVDETIPTHQNIVYYRLNQLDYNGESELSDVRVVQFKGFGDTPLVAYPNPTRSQVTILLGDDVSQGEYTITDFVGKQWMADIVRAGSKSVELDLSSLPSGVYIATLNSEGNNKHVRIVKQ